MSRHVEYAVFVGPPVEMLNRPSQNEWSFRERWGWGDQPRNHR